MNAATLHAVTSTDAAGRPAFRKAVLVPHDFSSLGPTAQRLCGRPVVWRFVGHLDDVPTWAHGDALVEERDLVDPREFIPPSAIFSAIGAALVVWAAIILTVAYVFL